MTMTDKLRIEAFQNEQDATLRAAVLETRGYEVELEEAQKVLWSMDDFEPGHVDIPYDIDSIWVIFARK